MIAEFEYKGIPVRIEFKTRGEKHTTFYVRPEDERLQRELLPLIFYYILCYNEKGRIPTMEEAKTYSAFLCIDRKAFGGDLTIWDPKILAGEAGVTEEFARYRIDLERQKR